MKAVAFSTFGGPEVLEIIEKPAPQPDAGEVLVAVAAATINPTDLMMVRGGQAAGMKDLVPPYTAGMDFSGRIVELGESVSGLRTGQPVIGIISPRQPRGGAQAELICVPAASVAPVGESIDLISAATIPMNALTAMLCLDLLGLRPGSSLLVTGATGMLGSQAARLASLGGLHVIANVKEADHAFVADLGVDTILPRGEGLEEALRAACPQGVDGVIDGAMIGQTISHLVRDGGGMVSPRSSYRIEDSRLNVHYVQVTGALQDQEKITRIGNLLEEGQLILRLAEGGVFSFIRAAEAYRMAQSGGLRGRVVLTFAD